MRAIRVAFQGHALRTKTRLAIVLLACLAATAADGAIGPAITVSVIEPAYAGMPIRIRIPAGGDCLTAEDAWETDDDYFGPGVEVEVEKDGVALPRLPRASDPVENFTKGIKKPAASDHCPGWSGGDAGKMASFVLNAEYDIDEAGTYRFRWTHRPPGRIAPDAQSEWVTFEVAPSTPAQRESWLTSQLASRPREVETRQIYQDYLSALFVARHDPRVQRVLLDLACWQIDRGMLTTGAAARKLVPGSRFEAVGQRAIRLLPYPQNAEIRDYARDWAIDGCIRSAAAALSGPRDTADRVAVVHAVVDQLKTDNGKHVTDPVDILWSVRLDSHSPRPFRAMRRWTEALAFLRATLWRANRPAADQELAEWADAELSPLLPLAVTPNSAVSEIFFAYFCRMPMTPSLHETIWQLTEQYGKTRTQAIDCLASLGDPADLPWLTSIFAGPGLDQGDADDYGLNTVRAHFGVEADPLFRTVMTTSPYRRARDIAAVHLVEHQDLPAIKFLIEALRYALPTESDAIVSDLHEAHILSANEATPDRATEVLLGLQYHH